ncbi:uncharacterized protein LOC128679903 isoform X2 [Plodia interpunctella]|uniref:uncharacterized protein LOC128679903 isoform X2 n=1 Tax=Plodia interpunctella TaxID=58824 RepID=UPI002367CCAC|nr:uncharacterized protein LOC128679903 [Plodia interpunctella]
MFTTNCQYSCINVSHFFCHISGLVVVGLLLSGYVKYRKCVAWFGYFYAWLGQREILCETWKRQQKESKYGFRGRENNIIANKWRCGHEGRNVVVARVAGSNRGALPKMEHGTPRGGG